MTFDPHAEDPGCPPGVPIVFCFADPCQVNSCPNFPEAECQSNYCGGCNALFFDADGNEVTDRCGTGSACEDGSPIVDCYVDPCTVSSCPNHREAECRANYCGGCRAWYFDGETNVTDTCRDTTSCECVCVCVCMHMCMHACICACVCE